MAASLAPASPAAVAPARATMRNGLSIWFLPFGFAVFLLVLRALPRRHQPLPELHRVVDDDPDDGQHDEDGESELDVHGARAAQQDVAEAAIGADELGDDRRRR